MEINRDIHIIRKCACCKEDICINSNNIDDAIYYDKKTYHSSCFINISEKRALMKNPNVGPKWVWVLEHMEKIKKESRLHLIYAIDKEKVYKFMQDTYDITNIPTTIWQKLANIYAGTFKGMSTGIPPTHLLDMWHRKIDMLNNLADKNKTRGKEMSVEQRLNYDLTVLVNKYDSYLKWLEKQKIIEAEKNADKTENIINQNISYISHQPIEEELSDTDNISDLVDDIFG